MLARWPGVPSVLLSMDIYTGTLAVESLYGLAPGGSAEGAPAFSKPLLLYSIPVA